MKVKNRSCIRRLSFRALMASRRRNLIAVFAIVLTTLLFTSLFTVAMSINSSYQTYLFRQIGGYSHGTFKEVTETQIQAIAAHPGVKATGSRKLIGFATEGVFAKVPAEISYMDENCARWSYAVPTTGRSPRSGNEIAMDTAALSLLGAKPRLGDEITLTYRETGQDGEAFSKTDTFVLTGYWEFDDICPVHYINISGEYAQTIEAERIAAGYAPFRTDLNVMMTSSLDIRGQMERVDLDLGYDWETQDEESSARIGVNWGYTTAQLGESMDATTLLGIIAFLSLVIFTGYLIIYNIFQISVTGDIRFYGLLKTIGVTPKQIRRIIRHQALYLCLAGIPAGLLAGYGTGALLTPVVMARTSFGASVSTLSSSPLIFLLSALFALATVLLSCSRPGRIASRIPPVEAAKYTENTQTKKARRSTRGAKLHQMAFSNLGRNRLKTFLVITSLGLAVVLLDVLVIFTGGFDMEKYLAKQICADFIVSSTGYFRFSLSSDSYLTDETMEEIAANTSQTLSGCGYTLSGPIPQAWMSEDAWRASASFISGDEANQTLARKTHRGSLVPENILIEGLDPSLFEKLTVVEGDLKPLFEENSNAIALKADTDDYGNVSYPEAFPALGDTLSVTYVNDFCYLDSRTGEPSDEDTPEEFLEYHVNASHDVDYTVCAYVTVPYSMSHRYNILGYNAVLPVDKMARDSGKREVPMFYLFDTADSAAEEDAEQYLSGLAGGELSSVMYESKATIREDFTDFQSMFLLLGGLLCAIIGLVGILNFFNAIMTGILSRKREFAVLQAVGMTNRQLKTMLIYEGLFYAVGAAAAALILSALLNPLAGKLLEDMFWFFSAHFTLLPVLAAIPAFALLGWLLPSVMYGPACRQSVVERLHRE